MFKSMKENLTSVCLSLIVALSVSGNTLAAHHGAHVPDSQSETMAMIVEHVTNFVEVANRGDIAEIAELYTEDAIQSQTNMEKPLYGRAAIKADMEKNADATVASDTLSAEVFTAQDLGNGYITANGSWEVRNEEGAKVRKGLWNNVFRVIDGETLLFRESTSNN
jgi:ketosteroid isomerase-like protein